MASLNLHSSAMHKMSTGIWEPPDQMWWNKEPTRKHFIWWVKSYFIKHLGELIKNESKRIETMVHVSRRQRQKLFWPYTENHDPYKWKWNWKRRTSARLVKSRCEDYLIERAETEARMHSTLCCLKKTNASINLFPPCTNT